MSCAALIAPVNKNHLLARIGAGLLFSNSADPGAETFRFSDESRLVESCLRQEPHQVLTPIQLIHAGLGDELELEKIFFGDDIQRQASARFHHAAEFLQVREWIFPEIDHVRCEHFVEGVLRIEQCGGVTKAQFDQTRVDSRGVASSGLLQHRLGKIHAHDSPLSGEACRPLNAEARAKADFQDMIGRLDIELVNRPVDPFAMEGEEESGEAPEKIGRLSKLLCKAVPQSHILSPQSTKGRHCTVVR